MLCTILFALNAKIAVVLVPRERFDDSSLMYELRPHFPDLNILIVARDTSGVLISHMTDFARKFLPEVQEREIIGQIRWAELPPIPEPPMPF